MSVKSHIGKVDQAKFLITDLDNVAKVDESKKIPLSCRVQKKEAKSIQLMSLVLDDSMSRILSPGSRSYCMKRNEGLKSRP